MTKYNKIKLPFFLIGLIVFVGYSCSAESMLNVSHINNITSIIKIESPRHYLLMPVEDNAPECRIKVNDGNTQVDYLDVRLAREKVDYYVPFDLSKYDWQKLEFEVSNCSFKSICWDNFSLDDKYEYNYDEKYRSAFHFTPPYGWTNDPNGMVWFNNEWHLFYQFNPYGTKWGNMTWGHAVSKDLCNWEDLEPAIYPDDLGTIFSGSCVIDKYNTAGFGKDAMVAIYTSAGKLQTQCIAYSNDQGRTFKKYESNPVLTSNVKDFRDPKVFWDHQIDKWVMVLAVGHNIEFYSSLNLKEWKFESRFGESYGAHGGIWECPDLVKLPVEGVKNEYKWVLIVNLNPGAICGGSGTQYFIGDFDGRSFTPLYSKEKTKWMDYGKDHYATVTWSNSPDNRCIALAWMNNWEYGNELPTENFRGYMSLPRELTLRKLASGEYIIVSKPISEISKFSEQLSQEKTVFVDNEYQVEIPVECIGNCFEISFELDAMETDSLDIKLLNSLGEQVEFSIDKSKNQFLFDRRLSGNMSFNEKFASFVEAPLFTTEKLFFRMIIDKSSIECFVNNGELAFTNLVFPSKNFSQISFYSEDNEFILNELTFTILKKGLSNHE